MKKHVFFLQRHAGRRSPRVQDGTVATMTIRSNVRCCSDALEFTCWDGAVVRVAFPGLPRPGSHRMGGYTAGTSGETIRDMMVRCVERRFGDFRAPHKVQWLTDNGSILPLVEPSRSPSQSIWSHASHPWKVPTAMAWLKLVKIFRRDYVRVNPIPDARTALTRNDHWMEDYNSDIPTPVRAIVHRGSTLLNFNKPRVRSNGGQLQRVKDRALRWLSTRNIRQQVNDRTVEKTAPARCNLAFGYVEALHARQRQCSKVAEFKKTSSTLLGCRGLG
jgi:putative transposase